MGRLTPVGISFVTGGRDRADYSGADSSVTVNLALTGAQSTGGSGLDTLIAVQDLTGSGFDDVLTGSTTSNGLIGGAGDDVLSGGGGTDTMMGGLGADVMTGGTGADTFIYFSVAESTAASRDRITDLSAFDILNLSAIDADTGTAGDQAFVRAASLGGAAGLYTLTFDAGTGQTLLQGDIDGDSLADLVIAFTGDVTGLGAGWVL